MPKSMGMCTRRLTVKKIRRVQVIIDTRISIPVGVKYVRRCWIKLHPELKIDICSKMLFKDLVIISVYNVLLLQTRLKRLSMTIKQVSVNTL